MKEKIKNTFMFTGFGNFEKVFGLVITIIIFILSMYFVYKNTFMF